MRHGLSQTRLYRIWVGMRRRCSDPCCGNYAHYGARDIRVCPEWEDFCVFAKWALCHGYADHLTIDRINNYGGYLPSNCRWATRQQQNRNRRNVGVSKFRTSISMPACIWQRAEALRANLRMRSFSELADFLIQTEYQRRYQKAA